MNLDTAHIDPPRLPTSAALSVLLEDLPPETASIGLLVSRLGERSFGLLLLVLALMGLAPGIATATTTLMPIIAIQMVLGFHKPALPEFLSARTVSSARFSHVITRLVPPFRAVEIFVRPRLTLPRAFATRFVGTLVLILSVTAFAPFPFYQIPNLAIALIAFAYLEEDGVFLGIALVATALSFAFTAGSAAVVVKAVGFLGRLWAKI